MKISRSVSFLLFVGAVLLAVQARVLADGPPEPPGSYWSNCSDQGYCDSLVDWTVEVWSDCSNDLDWEYGSPGFVASTSSCEDICSEGTSFEDACQDYCLNYFCPGQWGANPWGTDCSGTVATCDCYPCEER